MGKKDYVLKKAAVGDMDALESVLGGLMSPLFDLAFHFYDDPAAASTCVAHAIEEVGTCILNDGLEGRKPMVRAAKMVAQTLAGDEQRFTPWHECLHDIPQDLSLCFLIVHSLNCSDGDLDFILGIDQGSSAILMSRLDKVVQLNDTQLRDVFDAHAQLAHLPVGLIDQIVTKFEDRLP